MIIEPDCGYFNEEKDDEYAPGDNCEDCYRFDTCIKAKLKEPVDIVRCYECGYYRLRKRDGELIRSYCIGPPGMPSMVKEPWDYCSRGRRKVK